MNSRGDHIAAGIPAGTAAQTGGDRAVEPCERYRVAALHDTPRRVHKQRISTVDGVAQVVVYGAQKYAVRIQLDPRELATRGVGIDEVVNAVSKSNVNLPTGVLNGPYTAYTVQSNGFRYSAEDEARIQDMLEGLGYV